MSLTIDSPNLDLNTVHPDIVVDVDKFLTSLFGDQPDDVPENERILVQVYLPHVRKYGHAPMMSLVYRWPGGPLAVGDLVLCPPSPRSNGTFVGVVISLDASRHPYKGYVKSVLGRVTDRDQIPQGA